MKTHTFWIPLIAMLLLATGLGAALMRQSDPTGTPTAVATPLKGEPAPALDLATLDVNTQRLTSAMLKGKPHLVNFFASWCGPCAMENPVLMHLAKQHKVAIIGIALKDSTQPLVQYLSQRGNPYDLIGLDDAGRTALDWGVTGVPETFAVDANGMILTRIMGGLSDDDADHLVQALLTSAK